MELPYRLYMEEQEQKIREISINNIIADVKRYKEDIIPMSVFCSICLKNGIPEEKLTDEELKIIKNKIKGD